MITLHKVEAENIRALGHAIFQPLTDGGLTAVNGPNGAGKSSILAALVWALYGVTPDGVPQTAMRRQGTEGVCRVIVDFEHDGQIITVERGLKGRNDSAYLRVALNGIEQAFGKIKSAEAWLVNLLGGLDSEGFMTAFVIRQKELDGLVKAKPAERRKLIERLAGIDRMSTAVKSAREEEGQVKKRLEHLPGDAQSLQAARDALQEAQAAAIEMWETYDAAKDAEAEASEVFEAAQSKARDMQARIDAYTEAERALVQARHQHAMAGERVTNARRELDQTQQAATGGSEAEVTAAQNAFNDANEALRANREARAEADRAVAQAQRDQAAADQAAARLQRAIAASTQAQADAVAATEKAAGFPADLDTQVSEVEKALAETTEKVGALRGEHERVSASIKAMEATTDAACPTCATALPDPTLVLTTLREARDRVLAEGQAAAAEVKVLEEKARSLRAQAQAAQGAAQSAKHLTEAATRAEAATNEAQEVADAAARAAADSNTAADAAKAQALSAAQETGTLTQAVETAQNALRVAQVAAAAAARVPALVEALNVADADAAVTTGVLTAAEQAEAVARVSTEARDTVFNAFESARNAYALAQQERASADGNYRVAEEQVRSADKTCDTEDGYRKARIETVALLEQKTAVREALDHFRKDRIASLAPELSEIATDQIARMTEGKFTAVELDEEFTPVITDAQGRQRPATWLSGGEESAVALALRLAIGEVIAGSHGGLLWMDEPQTAMDAQRRPAMMSVIRDLTGRQPIIISHVTEASDMVDLVLEVLPDEIDGSTVALAAGTGRTVDEATLDLLEADDPQVA